MYGHGDELTNHRWRSDPMDVRTLWTLTKVISRVFAPRKSVCQHIIPLFTSSGCCMVLIPEQVCVPVPGYAVFIREIIFS